MNRGTNTSCSRILESIDAYLDGELQAGELSRFEGHVIDCARCQCELTLAQSVLSEIRRLPDRPCPDELTRRILHATRESVDERPGLLRRLSVGRWMGLRAALVGGVALAVLVLFFGERRKEREEQFTEIQIQQAQEAARWTFAYVNDISRRSGLATYDEVFATGLVEPVKRVMQSVIEATPDKKRNNNGG